MTRVSNGQLVNHASVKATVPKVWIVDETYLPGTRASLVACRHGMGGSQVFRWRRRMDQGALTAAEAGEEVVPASNYRAPEA